MSGVNPDTVSLRSKAWVEMLFLLLGLEVSVHSTDMRQSHAPFAGLWEIKLVLFGLQLSQVQVHMHRQTMPGSVLHAIPNFFVSHLPLLWLVTRA